ncbi:MAG: radical SAM protein [Firmicutes bacterium]|nr:radical SAM protein [Bacillota bacterium]
MAYKLSESVFYRLYGNQTTLYDTLIRKVYIFNETVKDLLDCFVETAEVAEVISKLKTLYDCADIPSFEEDLNNFISQLAELKILREAFKHKQVYDSLVGAIANNMIASGTLYSAMLELCFRCNESCRHCYVVENKNAELTTSEVFKVLDELYRLNVLEITFTGGEVFLREDFGEILDYAYKKRFCINIFTNATLISDSDLIKLASLHIKSLSVSLYSHIPKKHDYITRLKGSFEKTMNAMRKALALGLSVNIKSTIMDYTKDDVSGLLDIAESLGATIQVAVTVNPKDDGNLSPLDLRIKTEEDYKKVIKTAVGKMEFCAGIAGDFKNTSGNQICGAGHSMVCIAPDGEVYPCNALRISLGNIKNEALENIWQKSPELLKWRKATLHDLSECKDCELLEKLGVCSFCPGSALQEKGSPFAKYDEACKMTAIRGQLAKS